MAEEPLKYKLVAADLRAGIRGGGYSPGSRLPSKSELKARHRVSDGPVDAALRELRAEGLVYSEQGKGTFVCDPLPSEEARADAGSVGEQIAGLRQEVGRLAELANTDDLRTAVGRVEANLIDLYGKLGYDYPHGGAHGNQKTTARSARR